MGGGTVSQYASWVAASFDCSPFHLGCKFRDWSWDESVIFFNGPLGQIFPRLTDSRHESRAGVGGFVNACGCYVICELVKIGYFLFHPARLTTSSSFYFFFSRQEGDLGEHVAFLWVRRATTNERMFATFGDTLKCAPPSWPPVPNVAPSCIVVPSYVC